MGGSLPHECGVPLRPAKIFQIISWQKIYSA
jgi:hypothetical protein